MLLNKKNNSDLVYIITMVLCIRGGYMNYIDDVLFNFPMVLTWITLALDLAIKLLAIYIAFLGIKALKKYINN